MTDQTNSAAIRLTGLVKRYGDITAVKGVNLNIAPGEIVALLGRNGAGKSTTIDMLLGLTKPDAGQVDVFGTDPATACSKGRIGAMLQIGTLPNNVTVREIVKLMSSLYPKALALDEVVERASIGDILDQQAERLSGGQRQRVRFAIAIVSDPDFLVLDEPTAAMDVEARRTFWAALREWAASGRTVLFATHYLEEADAFADRIVLMRAGEIVADGATTEIRGMVQGRSIRCTMDITSTLRADLSGLPNVTAVEIHGDGVLLNTDNSDTSLRALLTQFADARDIEVTGLGIEDAFLALTESETVNS